MRKHQFCDSMKAVHGEDFGDKLINDFLKVFDEHSIKNKPYGRLILHVVLGQALKNICFRVGARRIDIRLHGLLIRPSGSGKGAGYGFYANLVNTLGFNNQLLTESTDAGLVGTAQINPQTREPELLPGLMVDADLISMEEASVLFDYQSDFSKKNLTYLQIAMNPLEDASCHISKRIGMLPEPIEFDPHCSFLLMTYIPDKFVDSLIKRGVIQRFIPIIQRVPVEERLNVVKIAIDRIGSATLTKVDDEYASVVNRLKIIINKYNKLGVIENPDKLTKEQIDKIRSEAEFSITDSARKALEQVIVNFTEMIKDTTMMAQEKLEEFTHRNFEILMKLAIHHALLSMKTTVNTADIIYAKQVYKPIWESLIYNIEDLLIPSQVQRMRYMQTVSYAIDVYNQLRKEKKYTKNDVWVRRLSMIDRLQVRWDNCSFITANKKLKMIETTNEKDTNKTKWFVVKKIGTIVYVKLIKDV